MVKRGRLITIMALFAFALRRARAHCARTLPRSHCHIYVQHRRRPHQRRRARSKGSIRSRSFRARLRSARRRPAPADFRFSSRRGGRQHRAAVRRERQHGRAEANAREAAGHVLSWLDESRDEVTIFTFDTHLVEVTFHGGSAERRRSLGGALRFAYRRCDAVAATARHVADRAGRRHAVVVFTDGGDNASRLTPAEVSGIASAIDVPIYIFGISAIDNPTEDNDGPSAQRFS